MGVDLAVGLDSVEISPPHWGLNPKLSWPEQVTILCHPGSTKINSVVKCQTSKKNTVYAHVYA